MKTAVCALLALIAAIAWTFRTLYVLVPLSLVATISIYLSRRKLSAPTRPATRVWGDENDIGSETLTAQAPNHGAARTLTRPFRSHKVTCNELIQKAAGDKAQLYLSLLPLELRAHVDRLVHSLAWHWTGQPLKISLPATMTASSWCGWECAPIDGGEELFLVKFQPRKRQSRTARQLLECHLIDLSKPHDASRSTRLKRHTSLVMTPTGELRVTQESQGYFSLSTVSQQTIAQFHNTNALLMDGGWLYLGTHLCSLANPARRLSFPLEVSAAQRAHCKVYGAEGDERLLTNSINRRGRERKGERLYNLVTGAPISEAGTWELWREGGVAYRMLLDCTALHDAVTGAHLLSVPSPAYTTHTRHWLVFFRHGAQRATCWSPVTPDRLFSIEFGDWELFSHGSVTWFRRQDESLLWCWDTCTGVRTTVPEHPSDQLLCTVNGAAIVYDPFDTCAPLYIVPLLHDPLESDEQRAKRTPPPQLPSDQEAPYVPARRLMVGRDLEVVIPKGSDTHPPLLIDGQGAALYRIVEGGA